MALFAKCVDQIVNGRPFRLRQGQFGGPQSFAHVLRTFTIKHALAPDFGHGGEVVWVRPGSVTEVVQLWRAASDAGDRGSAGGGQCDQREMIMSVLR